MESTRVHPVVYLDYYTGRNALCPFCGVRNDLGKCDPEKWETFDKSVKPKNDEYNCLTCGIWGCGEKCKICEEAGQAMIFSEGYGV